MNPFIKARAWRGLFALVAWGVWGGIIGDGVVAREGAEDRPNVVFVLVDDLGWADLGYSGSEFYETPNVDGLAKEGMVFSDFYAAGPVCSPTRASIMTGKYPPRTGVTTFLLSPTRDADHVRSHLPLEEFTMGEAFQKQGYTTGYFGKWHLGYESAYWAGEQGFEVAKGGIDLPWAWTLCYPGTEAPTAKTWPRTHTRFFSPYHLTHLENGPEGEYLTDRLTDETIRFIEERKDEPFFAFLSFHTVHTPLQAKPEVVTRYRRKLESMNRADEDKANCKEKQFQDNPNYAAMVEHMDANVGRLLEAIDALGMREETIVVFTSDNGGKGSVTSNLPMRGMKHNLYEGGIRVPVIVRWPGKIEAGSESAEPLISNDFYPTLLDLAGVPMEPGQHVDGVSFGEVLLGNAETVSREALYWHYPHGRHEAAVRAGRYKLLQRFEKDEVELYDLEADAGERVDMSEEKPALAAELLAQLKGWQKGVGARFAGEKLDTREAAAKPHLDETARFNVLFIAADDWNDWVGCLGDGQAQTPHVDGLAARGMLFTNAHCAAPVCNPSRAATLTGLRPDTTGVYENNHRLRKLAPEVVTLPQYFRENGYHVAGGGKIFHDVPPHCDDPLSWDEYFWWNEHGPKGGKAGGAWRSPYSISPDPELPGRPIRKIAAATKRNFEWGAVDEAEENWPDHQVATWASDFLEREHEEPFFLAVGIFRPHVPWFNPKKYFEMYPLERVVLPEVKADDLDDVGEWARRRARDGNSKHEKVVEFGEWEAAVQAYLASISHADANIGRVLEALAGSAYADDTIIVFWSDHGYHLGEKEHWHKRTLWERATHVPVIVVAPGVTEAGARCSRPVNLLDLYPTLVELCGLEVREELEGRSLVPLLEDSKVKWPHASVTTYLKGNHAVRTEDWRYIRYGTGEEELYDHRSDPHEWENLAGRPEYQGRLRKMNVFLKGLSE